MNLLEELPPLSPVLRNEKRNIIYPRCHQRKPDYAASGLGVGSHAVGPMAADSLGQTTDSERYSESGLEINFNSTSGFGGADQDNGVPNQPRDKYQNESSMDSHKELPTLSPVLKDEKRHIMYPRDHPGKSAFATSGLGVANHAVGPITAASFGQSSATEQDTAFARPGTHLAEPRTDAPAARNASEDHIDLAPPTRKGQSGPRIHPKKNPAPMLSPALRNEKRYIQYPRDHQRRSVAAAVLSIPPILEDSSAATKPND